MSNKWKIIFVFLLMIVLSFSLLMSSYADDAKDQGIEKAPPAKEEQMQKQENIGNTEDTKHEERNTQKKSETKKKIPAFWVLIPEQ
ncbi:MAG TPA: hypothetical protein PLT82_06370 [Candidatus Hydrogenedens sp.]|nr:hypothetical protein [Candidatus Hydrogenedens sp.]HOL19717.1 hypothetical protein [Candidatus Hydrogenedens sp.]HPP58740.1 hypothetical protein [Candidatus Hydrogenedens sp.]